MDAFSNSQPTMNSAAVRTRQTHASKRPSTAKSQTNGVDVAEEHAEPTNLQEEFGVKKTSRIRHIAKRLPLINFLYFLLDDQPPTDDITKILESLALVAALVFTMTIAIPSFVATEELEQADCQFAPGGIYGCYDFQHEHDYETISLALSSRCAYPTYSMFCALVASVILLFSLNSLNKTSAEDSSSEAWGRIAKAITGGITDDDDGVPAMVTGKWWDRMKWVVTIIIGLICYGSAYLIQAATIVVMIKFPSPYLERRCAKFGYAFEALKNETRMCHYYSNSNSEMFDDGPGIGGLYILTDPDALEFDPSTRWWLGYYISSLLVLLTAAACGYATLAADKAAQELDDQTGIKWKWAKVLFEEESEETNPPMFYPKNSPFHFGPRKLRENEVFLLLSQANDEFWQVISVPWTPLSPKEKSAIFNSKRQAAPAEKKSWKPTCCRSTDADAEAQALEDVTSAYSFAFAQEWSLLLAATKFVELRLMESKKLGYQQTETQILGDYMYNLFKHQENGIEKGDLEKLGLLCDLLGPLGTLSPLREQNMDTDVKRAYDTYNSIKKSYVMKKPAPKINAKTWEQVWGSRDNISSPSKARAYRDSDYWWRARSSFEEVQNRFGETEEQSSTEETEDTYDRASAVTELEVESDTNWKDYWLTKDENKILSIEHLRLTSLECGYVHSKWLSTPTKASRAIYAFATDTDVIEYYMGSLVAQDVAKQRGENPITTHEKTFQTQNSFVTPRGNPHTKRRLSKVGVEPM
eukprot:m.227076 g.227076  ORF g.227076 m.227076 type:complete len:754 (-) comp33510_c1_seq4:40-2301(-)